MTTDVLVNAVRFGDRLDIPLHQIVGQCGCLPGGESEPGFVTRTTSHREAHNILGMQNSWATYEGVLALRPNERPYVMTRASYAGGQR